MELEHECQVGSNDKNKYITKLLGLYDFLTNRIYLSNSEIVAFKADEFDKMYDKLNDYIINKI